MTQHLAADSVRIQFQQRVVISGGFIHAETGKITGLLGRNGNGKSSFLQAIFGAIPAEFKSVRVNGEWVPDLLSVKGLAAYLPQQAFVPDAFRVKTVFDLYDTNIQVLQNLMPELKPLSSQRMDQVSGGERRLIETLLVLFRPVSFVLLDEPFSFLSPVAVERLYELLQQEKTRKGIILTDHRYRSITSISDSLYLLANQRTYLIQHPDELIRWGYLHE